MQLNKFTELLTSMMLSHAAIAGAVAGKQPNFPVCRNLQLFNGFTDAYFGQPVCCCTGMTCKIQWDTVIATVTVSDSWGISVSTSVKYNKPEDNPWSIAALGACN